MFAKRQYALLTAFCVIAVWAETFVSSKIILDRGLAPADIFFYRFVVAYLLIWLISPKRLFADSFVDELRMMALGIFGGSLYFLTENSALAASTASNVAIIVCSAPIITAVLMANFYKDEVMNAKQIVGSCVAFLGMVLVIFNGEVVLKLNPKGDILAFSAALTWGFYSLIIKRLSGRYPTRLITRKVFAYGILTILPYFFFVHPLNFDAAVLSQPAVWANLVYLSVVASLMCFLSWNWCLKVLGTVKTTNLIYCQPFFTMLFSFIVLDERITWMAVAGTLVLTVGTVMVERNKKRISD